MKRTLILSTLIILSATAARAGISTHTHVDVSTFTLEVDYGSSVDSLVVRGGYDWKSSLINDLNFQSSRSGKIPIILEVIYFSDEGSSEDIIMALDALNLRPAELHELLSFGIRYPTAQQECAIVALGSLRRFANGMHGVPVLWGRGDSRYLSLGTFEIGFGSDICFAAVRK